MAKCNICGREECNCDSQSVDMSISSKQKKNLQKNGGYSNTPKTQKESVTKGWF